MEELITGYLSQALQGYSLLAMVLVFWGALSPA